VENPVKYDTRNKDGKNIWRVDLTSQDKPVSVPDFVLMEILKLNDWNRPIYFSTAFPNYAVNGYILSKYLTNEGLVNKLNSYEAKTSAEKLYSNLTQVYTYDGLNDKHIGYIDDMNYLIQNYRRAFFTLASEYDKSGNKEKAKEVMEFMPAKLK
jgi:hypothetical protein